jgi:hypothetical protein
MKKITAFAVLMIVASGAFAQDAISKLFAKYQSDESFSQVNISSKMFGLVTNMEVEKPEDKEVLNAISKIKGLRILGKENTSDAKALYKEAFALVAGKEFEELMSVRDKDKDMKFYIKESGGKISELVMIMGGTDDFMVMSIFGEIDLKQISKIGQRMDVSGLENLQKLHKDGDKDEKSKDNSKEPAKKSN